MPKGLKDWLGVLDAAKDGGNLDAATAAQLHQDLTEFSEKNAALQTEFDELNHMLTHQPPSAWAKREKKYHDDKKAWDTRETDLKKKLKRIQDEMHTLKDSDRAVKLQEQVGELQGQLSEVQKQLTANQKALEKAEAQSKSLEEERAKLAKAHQEAVQEQVSLRMAMTKNTEQLASKTAEAAAEAQKANEARRLLEGLKRDYNESSLKGDGLKEQLESMRSTHQAHQKKSAAQVEELQQQLQNARLAADEESSRCADTLRQVTELTSQLAKSQAAQSDSSAAADADKQQRIAEKEDVIKALQDAHAAEITSLRRQLMGMEDRTSALAGEKAAMQETVTQLQRDLSMAKQSAEEATAAAEAAVSAAASAGVNGKSKNGAVQNGSLDTVVGARAESIETRDDGNVPRAPAPVAAGGDGQPAAVVAPGGVVVSDVDSVPVPQQVRAWNRVMGNAPLPKEQEAMLSTPANAAILGDLFSALDKEQSAAAQSRLQVTACKLATHVPSPMSKAKTEASLMSVRRLPQSKEAVLRAAAKAGALGSRASGKSMDMDHAEVATAFARALASDSAHKDNRLVSVANAVTLCDGMAHDGHSLSRARIGLLRATATRSSSPEHAKYWKNLSDEEFLTAFSMAMVAGTVQMPSGETISVPHDQQLLFQAAAGAAMVPEAAPVADTSGMGAGGSEDGDGPGTPCARDDALAGVTMVSNIQTLDLSALPNTPASRALREYAAQCETHVQMHQAQVERLSAQLNEKDNQMAELEERLRAQLAGETPPAAGTEESWLPSLGRNKQMAERIKVLEAQLKLAEQKLTRLKEKGAAVDDGSNSESLSTALDEIRGVTQPAQKAEDSYLTSLVVKLKVDMAEVQGELVTCKRALARALERETKLHERVVMLESPMPKPSPKTPRMNWPIRFNPNAGPPSTPPPEADLPDALTPSVYEGSMPGSEARKGRANNVQMMEEPGVGDGAYVEA